jgi:protein Tex
MNILEQLARELNLKLSQVENTVALIDEGNTIPFIARYRKEVTGELSDEVLRNLDERLSYLRNLEDRKQEVLRLIEEQGKLTEELQQQILEASVLQRVEDLYKPFKQKKSTRASKARERGLEPLAEILWAQELESGTPEETARPFINPELGVETEKDALQGAMDIIAERISDDPELTAAIRKLTLEKGLISSEGVDEEEKTPYDMYYHHQEAIAKIPNHRVLAINRGEKEKKLKVKVLPPTEGILEILEKTVLRNGKSIFAPLLQDTLEDSYKRLIAPSMEREMRSMLTERAELEAVKVFAKNTEKLLMVPPVKGARIISIDPGYRTGCKVAVLSDTGKLLAYTTIYPTEPRKDIRGTEATLAKMVEKYQINTIVIGNGTGSRETEEVVADFIRKNNLDVRYTIVNEAGASVYSASKLATEEYPDLDVTTRGAMSLGRRLQDPLAELVKISPKHIGVGQYQHDINQTLLEGALTNVVEDCVNRVGVDLNTASPSLLSYIAGINMTIARNIVQYREEKGTFNDRKELKKVAKLGEKTFLQCAGFMRINGGKNPLDATSVHPESYKAAEAMLNRLGISKEGIVKGGVGDIQERIESLYPGKGLKQLAEELEIGTITLKDILEEIRKPARDPREDAPAVIFRNDVRNFEDLKVDMELQGTVRNVVDFGAFVDIGLKNDGLVHISQMSDRFIRHPMDVVSVGDTVKVKILSVDTERGKISLTMKI